MKFIFLFFPLMILSSVSAQTTKNVVPADNMIMINSQSSHFEIDSALYRKKDNNRHVQQKSLAYYDSYINALITKMSIVDGDSIQRIEAINSGWFDQMNANLEEAKKERAKLIEP